MSLLPLETYNLIYEPYRNAKTVFVQSWGNVGDQIMWVSKLQLIKRFGITHSYVHITSPLSTLDERIKNSDVVFWNGGGNMGTLHRACYKHRLIVSKLCTKYKKPFIIEPQSWTSKDDETKADKFFAREHYSIERYKPDAIFCHDLAFGYEMEDIVQNQLDEVHTDVGIFFRTDIEASKIPSNNIKDPVDGCISYIDYFKLASGYNVIHTNRIHFAVCSTILGKKVYLYPNSYYKNEAIYNASLHMFKNIEFIQHLV